MILNSAAVRSAMLRKAVGVTKLAELSQIPPRIVSRAHRKDVAVRVPTLAKLAKALQVEPLELVKAVT